MDETKRKEIWDSFLEAYKKKLDECEFLKLQNTTLTDQIKELVPDGESD